MKFLRDSQVFSDHENKNLFVQYEYQKNSKFILYDYIQSLNKFNLSDYEDVLINRLYDDFNKDQEVTLKQLFYKKHIDLKDITNATLKFKE